jgi:hypothetical protein
MLEATAVAFTILRKYAQEPRNKMVVDTAPPPHTPHLRQETWPYRYGLSSQKQSPHCIQHPPTTKYKFLAALPFEFLLPGHGRESPGDWPRRRVRREEEEIKQPCLEGWGTICTHKDTVFFTVLPCRLQFDLMVP